MAKYFSVEFFLPEADPPPAETGCCREFLAAFLAA